MIAFKKARKRLWNVYDKELKKLHKRNFKEPNNNLDYFVLYLRFMRDYYVLEQNASDSKSPLHKTVSGLATAIAEYELYQNCIGKYFRYINGKVEKLRDGTDEEVKQDFSQERAFHWGLFWRLVTLNMEDWLSPNVAV